MGLWKRPTSGAISHPAPGHQSLNPFCTGRYNFNDAYVTPISPEDIVTPASYMLFYRQRNLDPSAYPVDRGPLVYVPTEAEIERHDNQAAGAAPWWRRWWRN